MHHQPNLFSADASNGSADPPKPLSKLQQPAPVWLRRLELFLRVAVRLYLGIFILVLPWWPRFWDENPALTVFPWLADWATHGAVRGVVSGFGVLNLWIAFQEALHYRDADRQG